MSEMSFQTKVPKELQAPRCQISTLRSHIGGQYATEVTTDMACRCPHIDAYIPKYLDSGSLGLGGVGLSNRKGSKRLKRLTISDLHFASVLSESTSKKRKGSEGNHASSDKSNYRFGEEEMKLDLLMSGGGGAFTPLFPGTFVEQVHKERDFEKMLCVEIAKAAGEKVEEQPDHQGIGDFQKSNLLGEQIGNIQTEVFPNAATNNSSEKRHELEFRPSNTSSFSASKSTFLDGKKPHLSHDHAHNLSELKQMRKQRDQDIQAAELKVEAWLEVIRQNRLSYWNGDDMGCKQCLKNPKQGTDISHLPHGDSIMQCLDCSLVGCGSELLTSDDGSSKRHMQRHFLLTKHIFAITCGEKGEIYCMKCGDFVYCDVFDSEKERVEINFQVPWFQWDRHRKLQRSFAFREEGDDFYVIPNHFLPENKKYANSEHRSTCEPSAIVVWKGFQATYPPDVSYDFILAAQRTLSRLKFFRGDLIPSHFLKACDATSTIAYRQYQRRDRHWKIDCPVGIHNAGNICYISSVIQCIFNLRPVQQFFLRDAKHDCRACEILRSSNNQDASSIDGCLACEVDRLILTYYGSTQGLDLSVIVNSTDMSKQNLQGRLEQRISGGAVNNVEAFNDGKLDVPSKEQGMPIVISDFLATAWQMKDMALLAGNEQHDSHEFMQVLLDIIDRDCIRFEKTVIADRQDDEIRQVRSTVPSAGRTEQVPGSMTSIFSGSFRSVLMCDTCGFKRPSMEPFLNVSLAIGKGAASSRKTYNDDDDDNMNTRKRGQKMDVRTCKYLHFVYLQCITIEINLPAHEH
jgi:hypothetical protein